MHINNPNTNDKEEQSERRGQIIEKARELFLRHGYKKTTLDDIGKACQLVKAACYYYFDSKEEIFAEVVRIECERMLAEMQAAIAAFDDPKAQLVAMMKAHFQALGPYLSGSGVAAEMTELLPRAASIRHTYIKDEAMLLQNILEAGEHRGVFKKQSSYEAAFLIIAAVQGVESRFVEAGDIDSMDKGVEFLLQLLLNGLCTDAGTDKSVSF